MTRHPTRTKKPSARFRFSVNFDRRPDLYARLLRAQADTGKKLTRLILEALDPALAPYARKRDPIAR